MDFKVSQKEMRLQPSVGYVDTYIPDVFELFLETDGDFITNAVVLEGTLELEQAALFASVRQRGSDSIDPETGIRWAELMLGEISSSVVLIEIKSSVREVSSNCDVLFDTAKDSSGNTFLAYTIQVAQT